MSKSIRVMHKGVAISITASTSIKKGVGYKSFQIAHYSSGQRKRLTFADLDEAKAKAREIAQAMGTGQPTFFVSGPLEQAIQSAMETLAPTALRIDKAALIFAVACDVVDLPARCCAEQPEARVWAG
jgi:hypothetical protein